MLELSTHPFTDKEIDLLIQQMRKSPHVGLMSKNRWKKLDCVYVAKLTNNLVGVCVLFKLKNWIKIGPIVILDKHQGKGYGKKLIAKMVDDYPHNNLYIGTSNPIVAKIVQDLGFRKLDSFFDIPQEIKIYLVKYFFIRLNLNYLLDALEKNLFLKRGKYSYFVKDKTIPARVLA